MSAQPQFSNREVIQAFVEAGNYTDAAALIGMKYNSYWVRAHRLMKQHNVDSLLKVPHEMEYEDMK